MEFERNSFAFTISRDMALAHGLVEPMPEEKREQDRWRREYEERRRIAGMVIPAGIRRLDELDDPMSRAILDLHARNGSDYSGWRCGGCDQGCSCDSAQWPCSTVLAVAAAHHIDMTDADLFERPQDRSLDLTSGWTETR